MLRKEPPLHMPKLMLERKLGRNVDWKMNWSFIPTTLINIESLSNESGCNIRDGGCELYVIMDYKSFPNTKI